MACVWRSEHSLWYLLSCSILFDMGIKLRLSGLCFSMLTSYYPRTQLSNRVLPSTAALGSHLRAALFLVPLLMTLSGLPACPGLSSDVTGYPPLCVSRSHSSSEAIAVDGEDFKKLFYRSEVCLSHLGKKGPSEDTSTRPWTQREAPEMHSGREEGSACLLTGLSASSALSVVGRPTSRPLLLLNMLPLAQNTLGSIRQREGWVVMNICHSGTWKVKTGGLGVQDHPQLRSEFKGRLSYTRLF